MPPKKKVNVPEEDLDDLFGDIPAAPVAPVEPPPEPKAAPVEPKVADTEGAPKKKKKKKKKDSDSSSEDNKPAPKKKVPANKQEAAAKNLVERQKLIEEATKKLEEKEREAENKRKAAEEVEKEKARQAELLKEKAKDEKAKQRLEKKQQEEEKKKLEKERRKAAMLKQYDTITTKKPPIPKAPPKPPVDTWDRAEELKAILNEIPDKWFEGVEGLISIIEGLSDGELRELAIQRTKGVLIATRIQSESIKTQAIHNMNSKLSKRGVAPSEPEWETQTILYCSAWLNSGAEKEDWEWQSDWESFLGTLEKWNMDVKMENMVDVDDLDGNTDFTSMNRSELLKQKLKSPVCCIMGHVDTGKTKLLDRIRTTDVQGQEAGGITQQIGATYFPTKTILTATNEVDRPFAEKLRLPGLLMIDTPGHEAFYNLRDRGSSLCDIAILVVDIMHGLENQTVESINLLKKRHCPFVIALNKVDRLFEWKPTIRSNDKSRRRDVAIRPALQAQMPNTREEFESRLSNVMLQFQEKGMNSCLYWDNDDLGGTFSIIPTSAHTGEGIPDLIYMIMRLTQERIIRNLVFTDILECKVLEVKVVESLGTVIDVILTNGYLRVDDRIMVSGLRGPIETNIRSLLTPKPLKEIRVGSSEYDAHKVLAASQGVRIAAAGLDDALPGGVLEVIKPTDDVDDMRDRLATGVSKIFQYVHKAEVGVTVVTSTLGSMEALLQFVKERDIAVSRIKIGTIYKADVLAASIAIEKDALEHAVILGFNVKVDKEAQTEAELLGVKIITDEIIYQLVASYERHVATLKELERQSKEEKHCIFPFETKVLQIINNTPLILGVAVERGLMRPNLKIGVMRGDIFLDVGILESIQKDKERQVNAPKGAEVAVKVNPTSKEKAKLITTGSKLYAKLSRESIDFMKQFHINDKDVDWKLMRDVRDLQKIPGSK